MVKRKSTTEYFDISKIINQNNTPYTMIYGQRDYGKKYFINNINKKTSNNTKLVVHTIKNSR